MEYHLIALSIGALMDLIIGDPHVIYHPVRFIGRLIYALERILYLEDEDLRHSPQNRKRGAILTLIVVLSTGLLVLAIMIASYAINICIGVGAEAILTFFLLAGRSLEVESMAVYKALKKNGLGAGKSAVAMIVGRDTKNLDESGVIKATVETVAENFSDGVIAPLIYVAIGGPVLGWMYKAINTMDSMLGYKNDRYEYFGSVPARLDDVVNFVPARISAFLLCLMSYVLPGYNGSDAVKIFKRDRFNHKSPNSAQTEAAMAGALGVQLAGDAYYFGQLVKKPYIGDAKRLVELEDIKRANVLMLSSAVLGFVIILVILMSLHL